MSVRIGALSCSLVGQDFVVYPSQISPFFFILCQCYFARLQLIECFGQISMDFEFFPGSIRRECIVLLWNPEEPWPWTDNVPSKLPKSSQSACLPIKSTAPFTLHSLGVGCGVWLVTVLGQTEKCHAGRTSWFVALFRELLSRTFLVWPRSGAQVTSLILSYNFATSFSRSVLGHFGP